MKRFITILTVLIFFLCTLQAQSTGNYKSSVKLNAGNYNKRSEVIIESRGQVRFLLYKNYKDAEECYQAFALFARLYNDADLVEMVPSVIKTAKEQGHSVKIIDDSYRDTYHGIAYNID